MDLSKSRLQMLDDWTIAVVWCSGCVFEIMTSNGKTCGKTRFRTVGSRLCSHVAVSLLLASCSCLAESRHVGFSTTDEGRHELQVDGRPYYIKGAGGFGQDLVVLKRAGANSLRVWADSQLHESEERRVKFLDKAYEMGISVTLGIWLGHERHGFDYRDPDDIARQRRHVAEVVARYKDHPALLMWGLGNEMEWDTYPERILREVNHLAGAIKRIDGKHPVMTAIAGHEHERLKAAVTFFSSIDALGINAYATADSVDKDLRAAGWKKPFLITEFGADGYWQCWHTDWGVPLEPEFKVKAARYRTLYERIGSWRDRGCVGSYCFFWGTKQEVTPTWFSMFLKSGEQLPTAEAMANVWGGNRDDANRCPEIQKVSSPLYCNAIRAGATAAVEVRATDADGDDLRFEWLVVKDAYRGQSGGDPEPEDIAVPSAIPKDAANSRVELTAPPDEGPYRLFVFVRDGKGNASSANFPFYVTGE